jgi:hydroxymethylglutaryl-CoA reductase (NADPH)
MAASSYKTMLAYQQLGSKADVAQLIEDIKKKNLIPRSEDRLPIDENLGEKGVEARRAFVREKTKKKFDLLMSEPKALDLNCFDGNIENYIGLTQVPTGIVGPLRVIGSAAKGDFFIPLATSEGALVASSHRGAKACYEAGGAVSVCLIEGVQRSPLFKFSSIADLGMFVGWILPQLEKFGEITKENSRYAELRDVRSQIEGNQLILTFEFTTGDASGQNMVTICTDAICQYIIAHSPIQPEYWFIEGNYSGDKKATALSFTNVRGKKVTSEIVIPKKIVESVLKTNVKAMEAYWRSSTLGIIQSGAIGAQGHYANALAALFLATGQDVACVAEAAIGITRMESTTEGDLYASVTLPNLIVGTVGGGTSLPTQKECLELMDCFGEGKARKFAEICGALVLAGELSIAAALSAGHFTSAHKNLGRRKKM